MAPRSCTAWVIKLLSSKFTEKQHPGNSECIGLARKFSQLYTITERLWQARLGESNIFSNGKISFQDLPVDFSNASFRHNNQLSPLCIEKTTGKISTSKLNLKNDQHTSVSYLSRQKTVLSQFFLNQGKLPKRNHDKIFV